MIAKLANYVIRPKRGNYDPRKDLGPPVFFIDGLPCSRTDFYVSNNRNQILQGSIYYRSLNPFHHTGKYACIVYCHGNSGDRTDSFEALKPMLSKDICVVCFDFAGCGRSEGDYITLGLNESKDIECIVNHIKSEFDFVNPERIGLWGRSMGAVSAILYASRRHHIKCVILDSPFSDLPALIQDIISKYKIVAKIAGNYILRKLRDKIFSTAGFRLEDLRPLMHIGNVQCPVLFIHSNKDELIHFRHSKELFEQATCEKYFLEMAVGHNDIRPSNIYEEIKLFVSEHLRDVQKDLSLKEVVKNPASLTSMKQNTLIDMEAEDVISQISARNAVNLISPRNGVKQISPRNLVQQLDDVQAKLSPKNMAKQDLLPTTEEPGIPRNKDRNDQCLEYFSQVETETCSTNNEIPQKQVAKNTVKTVRVSSVVSSRRGSLNSVAEKEIPLTARGRESSETESSINILTPELNSRIGESSSKIKESEKFNFLMQSIKPRVLSKNKGRNKMTGSMDQTSSNRNNFRIQASMRSTGSSAQRSHDEYELKDIKSVLKNPSNTSRVHSKDRVESESSVVKVQKSVNTSWSITDNTLLHLPQLPKMHDSDLKRIVGSTIDSNKTRLPNTIKLVVDKNRVYSAISPIKIRKERVIPFKLKLENK